VIVGQNLYSTSSFPDPKPEPGSPIESEQANTYFKLEQKPESRKESKSKAPRRGVSKQSPAEVMSSSSGHGKQI